MHYNKTVWIILVIFSAKITLSSRVIIISVLTIKSHDGAHRHKYLYQVVTSVIFSKNIMCHQNFIKRNFHLVTYYRITWWSAKVQIFIVCCHIMFRFICIFCVGWNLIKGHFFVNVHQGIMWYSPYEWLNVHTVIYWWLNMGFGLIIGFL